jgi:hypothetical protein
MSGVEFCGRRKTLSSSLFFYNHTKKLLLETSPLKATDGF